MLAITLKLIPFEDRHRIVSALTEEHGRVTAIARNSVQSRRFGGALDLFVAADWDAHFRDGAEMGRIDGAIVRREFPNLRRDYDRLSAAAVVAELMGRIAPEQAPAPELFKLLANALHWIDESPEFRPEYEGARLLACVFLKSLQWSGCQPQFSACRGCGRSVTDFTAEPGETEGRGPGLEVETASFYCSGCADRGKQGLVSTPPHLIAELLVPLSVPLKQAMEAEYSTSTQAAFEVAEALLLYHVPGLDQTPLKSIKPWRATRSTEPLPTATPL